MVNWHKKPNILVAIAIFSLLGVVFFLMLFTATWNYSPFKYAITIDAGSTHSKAILFKWKADKLNGTGMIEQVHSCQINQGIAAYAYQQVYSAADDLMDCIQELSHHLDRGNSLEHTFIYLGATAGMRMLNLSDPVRAKQVFALIKDKCIQAGLKPKRISIITGQEEGLFAWVAVNYLSGIFFNHSNHLHQNTNNENDNNNQSSTNQSTYGVLDMGGASAQIAHQINTTSSDVKDSIQVRLYGKNYTVHTYSNFCFGTEQALNRYLALTVRKNVHLLANESAKIEAPCLPKGLQISSEELKLNNICITPSDSKDSNDQHRQLSTSNNKFYLMGTSQFEQCRQVVDEILDYDSCKRHFRYCFAESTYPKRGTFFAISAYYYLTDVLNIKDEFDKIDFAEYLNETYNICENDLSALQQKPRLHAKYLSKYCFQLTYLQRTLTKVYHFDETNWQNLRFTSYINDTYLGWVLGFMISESNHIPSEVPIAALLVDTNWYTLPGTFLLFVSIVCSVCVCKQIAQRKKQQTQRHTANCIALGSVA